MKKRSIFLLVIVVIAALMGYRFWRLHTAKPAVSIDTIQKTQGIPVQTFTVRTQSLERTVSLAGSVAAFVDVSITPMITERIVALPVDTGQTVHKGQVLVRMDDRAAKAQRDAARAELLRLQNGSRPQEIAAAAAKRDQAKADMDLAAIEKERQDNLYAQQVSTLQAAQDAGARYETARAVYEAAKAQAELTEIGPRAEDIAAGQARLDAAQKNLDDHTLISPCHGQVSHNTLEVGDIAQNDKAIFRVLRLDKVYLDIDVSERYIPAIAVGQSVEVTVDAYGDRRFAGTVAQINPAAVTSSRSYLTRIVIDNADGLLREGMFGRAHIVVGHADEAIMVPSDAVHSDATGMFVWVVGQNNTLQRTAVDIGQVNGDRTEITEGLSAGKRVVTLGRDLTEGALVATDPNAVQTQPE